MKTNFINCNICRVNNAKFIGLREGFSVVRCRNCGLYYLNPMPEYDVDEIQAVYNNDYYIEHWRRGDGRFGPHMQAILKLSARLVLDKIESYLKPNKLLEVGCGYGEILIEARERNWNVKGVEISSSAVNYLKQFDLDIFCCKLEEAHFNNEEFDVVVFRELLEHLNNPYKFLIEVNRIVKTDGFVYVTVPNEASFYHKFFQLYYNINPKKRMKKETSHLGPPYHLLGFSKKALIKILESTGFQPLEIIVTYPGSKISPSLQLANMNFKQRVERLIIILGGITGMGSGLQILVKKIKNAKEIL
jgi:2-polyprenyl-3-methyl-5-hydroxy-6-metoxy-1,4-benzoquinol methylase